MTFENYILMVIALLSGLGVFIIGMKMMSDSIEKLADTKFRGLFNRVGGNRFVGVGIGLSATALIQSSSATTVMVVGFVNAGIMSLTSATAIIMGANIGTTITAHIATLQAYKFSSYIIVLTMGIFLSMFSRKDRVKTLGNILAGLGLLFVGLGAMSTAMVTIKDMPVIVNALQVISNPFLLLFIGIAITAIIQSSSAVTGILVTLAAQGIIIGNGGNSVLFVVLGTNIGTCVTALIATIGTNANGKRAALIHILFNVIGSMVFMVILLLWPTFMTDTLAKWFDPAIQISMFHTFFNVITVLLLLPFVSILVKLSKILIKEKPDDVAFKLHFIDDRMLRTPTLAVAQLIKEIANMGHIAEEGAKLSIQGVLDRDLSNKEQILHYKNNVEWLSQQITQYLVKVTSLDLSYKDEIRTSSFYHVVSDINRVSDFTSNFIRYTEQLKADDLTFSEGVTSSLNDLFNLLKIMFRDCLYAFERRYAGMLSDIDMREEQIDIAKRDIIAAHIKRLNEGICNPKSSVIFINFVGNLERMGDHLTNIAHSVEDETQKKAVIK